MNKIAPWLSMSLLAMILAAPAYTAPVIDNERVTVWDVPLTVSASGPMTPHDNDAVILFLEGGQVRTVDRSGKARIATRNFGDAVYVPKGTDATDTLVSGGPAREVVIALKDHAVPPFANTSGYPVAFPRPGAVKGLDEARFTTWHFSWTPNVATGMHVHDKDFVVVFRFDSSQTILEPDGATHINHVKAGDILFLKRGLTHSEGLASEHQSAVYLELE
jgi:mannose-6-phosphate isomerase-like protein (cupin superfamily)